MRDSRLPRVLTALFAVMVPVGLVVSGSQAIHSSSTRAEAAEFNAAPMCPSVVECRQEAPAEVLGTYWHGAAVRVRDSAGHSMDTPHNPAWQVGNAALASILSALISATFLAYLMITRLRQRRQRRALPHSDVVAPTF